MHWKIESEETKLLLAEESVSFAYYSSDQRFSLLHVFLPSPGMFEVPGVM